MTITLTIICQYLFWFCFQVWTDRIRLSSPDDEHRPADLRPTWTPISAQLVFRTERHLCFFFAWLWAWVSSYFYGGGRCCGCVDAKERPSWTRTHSVIEGITRAPIWFPSLLIMVPTWSRRPHAWNAWTRKKTLKVHVRMSICDRRSSAYRRLSLGPCRVCAFLWILFD